jgi:UDP-N-acetylmuramyl pentapeptide phosphotransferase/UDP-N-acetylglucosamine-1-phosphate transferase
VVVSSATDAPLVVGAGVAADGVGAAGGAQVPSGGGSTLFVTVSPLVAISSTTSTFVTTWALALAAAAVVALLFIDRLKPSRPRWQAARARRRGQPLEAIGVVEEPTVLYRRTPIWKRVLSLGGLGVMSVVLGALLATVAAIVAIAALTLLGGLS